MPYLHKFGQDEILINRMATHPSYNFTLYSGSAYINNDRHQGINIPNGVLSLYEYNVDRTDVAAPGANKVNSSLISPYVIRDGNWLAFQSVLMALKNTMNYYRYLSDKYEFVNSYVSGTVNMIEVPSIFYGSSISKGTVSLKFYFTGTLIDEAIDSRQNGELISTMGSLSGSTVGMVLYNEGFILLTSSADITTNKDNYIGNLALGTKNASWQYFGAYNQANISGSDGGFATASLFSIDFKGTQKIPTMTMFATAKKGEANNSLNPTWLSSSNGDWRSNILTGSGGYIEPRQLAITNTIQNQYCEYDSPFDEHKNLIGVAKLANPVMKQESQDFTFKLKLDM